MDAIDYIYVAVGYKLDEASVREIRQSFAEVRRAAGGIAKEISQSVKGMGRLTTAAKDGAKEMANQANETEKRQQGWVKWFGNAVGIAKTAWPVILGIAAMKLAQVALGDYQKRSDELIGLASATSTTVESISELAYVARIAGVPVEDLRDGLNDLSEKTFEANKAIDEGKGKTNEFAQTFKALGLNVKDLMTLSPEERFIKFGEAIRKVQDPAARSRYLMQLMSDEGTKFNRIFNLGESQIRAFRKEARDMGAVLGKDGVKEIGRYTLAMARLDTRLEVIRDGLSQALMPVVSEGVEELVKGITAKDVADFAKQSRMIASSFKDVLIPTIHALLSAGRGILRFTADMGGLGNVLKLATLLFAAYKVQALLGAAATWKFQAATAAGAKSAALMAGKVLLLVAPLLLLEDIEVWKAGGESAAGDALGAPTVGAVAVAEAALMGLFGVALLVFKGIATAAVGAAAAVPLAIAAAIAGVAALAWASRKEFEMVWYVIREGTKDLIGHLTNLVPDWLRELFGGDAKAVVSATQTTSMAEAAAGRAVNNTATTSTTNNNTPIQVAVYTQPGADAQAIGGAASDGVDHAARRMQNNYNG